MKNVRKNYLGNTWLGWINILLFQWFFVRLAEEKGRKRRWVFIGFIWPTTGWNTEYKYVGKK